MTARPHIAVEPQELRPDLMIDALVDAVPKGGGEVVAPDEAEAIVWGAPHRPDLLEPMLGDHIRWVQLPYAGIEPYLPMLDHQREWTCGKEVYAEAVAEHILALLLGAFRTVIVYSRANEWVERGGRNLLGARVLIVGGGAIARYLVTFLTPLRCEVTVVRRHPQPMAGVGRVVGPDELLEVLPDADAVVLALPLTPESIGLIGAVELEAMDDDAWLINSARGQHVETDALVAAMPRRGDRRRVPGCNRTRTAARGPSTLVDAELPHYAPCR